MWERQDNLKKNKGFSMVASYLGQRSRKKITTESRSTKAKVGSKISTFFFAPSIDLIWQKIIYRNPPTVPKPTYRNIRRQNLKEKK
jgi:hypothetical protein